MDATERSHRVDRAATWAKGRPLEALWQELHRRMGASDRPVRTVTVELQRDAADALTSMFGRASPLPVGRQKVSVANLELALGVDAVGLRDLLERLVGPLENRARARAENAEARERLFGELDRRIGALVPETLARLRLAGDLDTASASLLWVADVIATLPLQRPTPSPILAWERTGDPHALDSNGSARVFFLSAVAELEGLEVGDVGRFELRRAAEALGVLFDRLSSPALTWALRAEPSTPAGRLLEVAAAEGAPVHLSSAVLDKGLPVVTSERVLCVENPSVLEWLHLTGRRIPVVCTSGWPSLDVQRLLAELVESGVELHYAGDYDRSGLEIASFMRERFSAVVRMDADVYGGARVELAMPWEGDVPATPWCPQLRRAICERQVVVYQEDPVVRQALVRG